MEKGPLNPLGPPLMKMRVFIRTQFSDPNRLADRYFNSFFRLYFCSSPHTSLIPTQTIVYITTRDEPSTLRFQLVSYAPHPPLPLSILKFIHRNVTCLILSHLMSTHAGPTLITIVERRKSREGEPE